MLRLTDKEREDGVIQVVMHVSMAERFDENLRRRGLYLMRLPSEMVHEDDLPIFSIGMSDELAQKGLTQDIAREIHDQ